MFQSRQLDLLVLLFVCFAAFWWRLGALGLIDPDEPFYAQTAREMVQSKDWVTPQIYGAPQFEKPIFYYWTVAASFALFGESELAGRAPTGVFATALVLLVWVFASRVWSARTGFLAALVLATSLVFCVMSRLMLTDVPLAFFLAAAIFSYWKAGEGEERRNFWIALSLACNGLAVLTKGPIGSLVVLFTTLAFGLLTHRKTLYRGPGLWWGLVLYAVIVVPWYAAMFAWHAKPFWEEFFVRDNFLRLIRAEHPANNHFWYYPGLLLMGSIPWMPAVALAVRRAFTGFRADPALLFQWCWLLTSLLFLTIAQSKLPSYGFYLFVPLAVIVGRSLDLLLERGFTSIGERRLIIGFAVFQCVTLLVLPFVKAAKPFTFPIALVAICLAVALVLLLQKRLVPWLLASSLASLALLAGALTKALPAVEAESSARPVARALLADRREGEPLVSGKFLVRGIIYYTRSPVTILASKPHPFWADHPLPIIVRAKGLNAFVAQYPSVLCALRKGDWASVDDEKIFATRDSFAELGENIVVRAVNPDVKKAE
ncbi:MAG: glycosyltransferase family 39 protein [Chthoniobacter sp.]|uniref:ArnT family glycosyltransferase n=1 Tax=Chthoniobacter sp. TaxID=2510640 RepID=UPI0032A878C9